MFSRMSKKKKKRIVIITPLVVISKMGMKILKSHRLHIYLEIKNLTRAFFTPEFLISYK